MVRDVGVEDRQPDQLLGARLVLAVGAAEALEAAVRDRRRRDVQVAQLGARDAHLTQDLGFKHERYLRRVTGIAKHET